MTEKDENCFVPCDTEVLMDKGTNGSKGRDIETNVKKLSQRRIEVTSAV